MSEEKLSIIKQAKIRIQALDDLRGNWAQGGTLGEGMEKSDAFQKLNEEEKGLVVGVFFQEIPSTHCPDYYIHEEVAGQL